LHRVLHIIPSFERSGAGKLLWLLARGLPRDRFDVHVCGLERDGPLRTEFREAGIPATTIGKRWQVDPLAFARLLRYIRRLQPDLVHTWLFTAGAYGRAAASAVGVKHLVAGEYGVERWKSTWQWTVDRRLARCTERFVTNSPAVRDYCAAHRLPTRWFEVIPNGIPPAQESNVSRAELLRELELPDDAHLIGVVSRLWPQKRVKDLIWAADLLRVLHDNLRLLVIGDGPERPTLERFARLASDLDHIRFLGHREDVWRILPHLDVFWNGSEYEGQSVSVMEAMAAGVPVVASDIPGNRELVVHGETGYLVPIAGRAARARATDAILSDVALSKRLGAAGWQRMLDHFSVEQNIRRHVEMYEELLA